MAVQQLRKSLSVVAFCIFVLALLVPVGSAQVVSTESPNQLIINQAYLTHNHGDGNGNVVFHCFTNGNDESFQPAQVTMVISGNNFGFSLGLTPRVYLGGNLLTLAGTPTDTEIDATFDCSDLVDPNNPGSKPKFTPSGSYRLLVSTGTGKPFNDGITFGFARHGNNGANGAACSHDDPDCKGPKGDHGDPCLISQDPNCKGPQGNPGPGGHHGKGVRRLVIPFDPADPAYQASLCTQGAAFAYYSQTFDEGSQTYVDDPLSAVAPLNPAYVCHGKNGSNGHNGVGHHVTVGDPGGNCGKAGGLLLTFSAIDTDGNEVLTSQQPVCHGNSGSNGTDGAPGRNGVAKGWIKNFGSAPITSTASNVLSQPVTGANGYVINAKLNAPFGNGAKSVTCNLVAVENGISSTIDSTDALLIGSNTVTAKGVIALGGVYKAVGGAAAGVSINVSCGTGGDTRTLTKGAVNVVATDTIN